MLPDGKNSQIRHKEPYLAIRVCKINCVNDLPDEKMGNLAAQPNRATLRSDPTQAVRYTVENGGGNAVVFPFHRYRPADKPQGGWGTESPGRQATNLSSKKIANCA